MITPHQWLDEKKIETTRYRFFYAPTQDGDVEVVLNAAGQIQIGLLTDDKYIHTELMPLLNGITVSSHYGHYEPQYEPYNIRNVLLTAARELSPNIKEILDENMEDILCNIKDFIEPYNILFSSNVSKLFEAIPQHQLYLFLRKQDPSYLPSETRKYILISRTRLPYLFTEAPPVWTFSTAFAEGYYTELSGDAEQEFLIHSFPSILKAKPICCQQTRNAQVIRVSFAPINPLNPSLVMEKILSHSQKRNVFGVHLTIAPFPILAFREYLRGGKIPKPQWLK